MKLTPGKLDLPLLTTEFNIQRYKCADELNNEACVANHLVFWQAVWGEAWDAVHFNPSCFWPLKHTACQINTVKNGPHLDEFKACLYIM